MRLTHNYFVCVLRIIFNSCVFNREFLNRTDGGGGSITINRTGLSFKFQYKTNWALNLLEQEQEEVNRKEEEEFGFIESQFKNVKTVK